MVFLFVFFFLFFLGCALAFVLDRRREALVSGAVMLAMLATLAWLQPQAAAGAVMLAVAVIVSFGIALGEALRAWSAVMARPSRRGPLGALRLWQARRARPRNLSAVEYSLRRATPRAPRGLSQGLFPHVPGFERLYREGDAARAWWVRGWTFAFEDASGQVQIGRADFSAQSRDAEAMSDKIAFDPVEDLGVWLRRTKQPHASFTVLYLPGQPEQPLVLASVLPGFEVTLAELDETLNALRVEWPDEVFYVHRQIREVCQGAWSRNCGKPELVALSGLRLDASAVEFEGPKVATTIADRFVNGRVDRETLAAASNAAGPQRVYAFD